MKALVRWVMTVSVVLALSLSGYATQHLTPLDNLSNQMVCSHCDCGGQSCCVKAPEKSSLPSGEATIPSSSHSLTTIKVWQASDFLIRFLAGFDVRATELSCHAARLGGFPDYPIQLPLRFLSGIFLI